MKSLVIIFFLFICGCAASGPSFSDSQAGMMLTSGETAKVVFFRTKETALYIARKAAVYIDDSKIGGTAYGGFHFHDVSPGQRRLRTEMWDSPGNCELTLNAVAGETYYFQVDPRQESFGAFFAAGTAASLISGGVLLADLGGGLAGAAAESYGKDCGGAFRLYPVDEETALSKLSALRLSE
ncbi:MAG: DUF2846 domain-containing protein [Woeseiaceae bacterium]|nr:DUF2846 domain-containing protein [Woeseiaceae bacterium]